jgi:hypothetical protein
VHAHEQELRELQLKLGEFGGSVLDGMAVDRRLRLIEDRMLEDTAELREGEPHEGAGATGS